MGCQEGGRGKIDQIIETSVAKKAGGGKNHWKRRLPRRGGGGKLSKTKTNESMGCQAGKGGGGREIIESMGCQEGGRENFWEKNHWKQWLPKGGEMLIRRKSLKAWVATKGGGNHWKHGLPRRGGEQKALKTQSLKARVAKKAGGGGGKKAWVGKTNFNGKIFDKKTII